MNRPTEAACQATIIDAATYLGYRVYHSRPALTQSGRWVTPIEGHAGFPDLTIAGHGRLWFRELKRKPRRLDPEQEVWLASLRAAGIDADVLWVPEDMQQFIDELKAARPNSQRKP